MAAEMRPGRVEEDAKRVTSVSHLESDAEVNDGSKLPDEHEPVECTEEELKRVRRKTDFILLPLMFGCYFFSVSFHCSSMIVDMY